jgi:hypothetical protein
VELIDEIRELVADVTNARVENIGPETTLVADLGVDGDDADELLDKYADQFRVSMDGFVFLDHFGWEGWWSFVLVDVELLRLISPRFRRLWKAARANERDITIKHLADCAAIGRWLPSSDRRKASQYSILWLPLFVVFFVPQVISGIVIAIGIPVFAAVAFFMGMRGIFVGHFGEAALGGALSILCAAATWRFSKLANEYLKLKQVWQRVSPVAS